MLQQQPGHGHATVAHGVVQRRVVMVTGRVQQRPLQEKRLHYTQVSQVTGFMLKRKDKRLTAAALHKKTPQLS